jgi:Fic family protein
MLNISEIHQIKLNMNCVNAIGSIDQFKGKWDLRGDFDPELLNRFYMDTKIEAIQAGLKMAGIEVQPENVSSYIVDERTNATPLTQLAPSTSSSESTLAQTDQFIWGYARAWNCSQDLFLEKVLEESHILKLHELMYGVSSKDRWHAGKYKISSNNILASKGVSSGVRPILETSSITDTPVRMSELIYWLDQERKTQRSHPLVRVLVFVLLFLEIHPFQDGNERLAKVLLRLLLIQEGYSFINYAPFETILETKGFEFYESWTKSHRSINLNQLDLDPWLDFMLSAIKALPEHLLEKIDIKTGNLFDTPSTAIKIMEIARMRHRFRIGDVISLTQGNRSTLKFHLRKLVESGKLKRQGQGAGIYYEWSIQPEQPASL